MPPSRFIKRAHIFPLSFLIRRALPEGFYYGCHMCCLLQLFQHMPDGVKFAFFIVERRGICTPASNPKFSFPRFEQFKSLL